MHLSWDVNPHGRSLVDAAGNLELPADALQQARRGHQALAPGPTARLRPPEDGGIEHPASSSPSTPGPVWVISKVEELVVPAEVNPKLPLLELGRGVRRRRRSRCRSRSTVCVNLRRGIGQDARDHLDWFVAQQRTGPPPQALRDVARGDPLDHDLYLARNRKWRRW